MLILSIRTGFLFLVLSPPFFAALVTADTYNMVKEYSGTNFFDEWTFYDNYDNLTNGDVVFLSASQAFASKSAFVDSSTKHAIISVDNSSTVTFNYKRNSVRIQTNTRYGVGSIWAADMLHVPYGCSVWPAWWSCSPTWPIGGEIDTFEGVNMMTKNVMALHTLEGCKQVGQNQSSTLVNSTDCSYLQDYNKGCITTDPRSASYGAAFAAGGGGVFVTEYAESGISIWFFPRKNVPTVLSSNSSTIDTATLGVPVGNWPSTQCNSAEFFDAQYLIFDITLCGGFAGVPAVFGETCRGSCYKDHVVGNGSNYAQAYFEIASVRVFSKQVNASANVLTSGSRGHCILFSGLSLGWITAAAVILLAV
ncbi:glycoside hydrolase family 16 protein [Hebeloma cylindrosporum]|uniref:Glycoside hydrolase family 16 protein n=1 Tax=Hebeloma cylindrosporum TaxID=76867 RepID=A0A0C2YPJ9_HEBCY|nr:glycoside hydrolase family 16 protein [Hebeloma cylindrosporum h7]